MSTSKSKSGAGTVYLVGAGPGNLGLVTLRARECIEHADVIVYDHLANPELLGWAKEGDCGQEELAICLDWQRSPTPRMVEVTLS